MAMSNDQRIPITKIAPSDLTACANLHCRVYNSPPWNDGWVPEKSRAYLDQLLEFPQAFGLVATFGSQIVGAIMGREKIWWNNNELYVEELFVAPEHQGHGIGSRLLTAVWKTAEEKHLAGVTLLTNRTMPALGFYQRHQFRLANHVVFLYKTT